jgi:HKD family nuclease
LFQRNTGFHTAYIGSSNFSRSALTDGLEWNLKVTTVGHIIDKFKKTFEAYWQNIDFELYDKSIHSEKLVDALNKVSFQKNMLLQLLFLTLNLFHIKMKYLKN